jgi:protein gp37
MSGASKIEWTDATWNPVTGCTKVSEGCDHCYAERITNRFGGPGAFDTVVLHPDRLDAPLRWRKPRRVFVNSMSDLFHDDVPRGFIVEVFAVMAARQAHTFQVLTKRPGRMASLLRDHDFPLDIARTVFDRKTRDRLWEKDAPSDWPLPNVWLGTSVENQKWADVRVPKLLETPAAVRLLSCEPLLGPVDLGRRITRGVPWSALGGSHMADLPGVDWVIVGGESGPGARPMHPEWARSLRDQCVAAGVPFFFKQWGEWAPSDSLRGVMVDLQGGRHSTNEMDRIGTPEGWVWMNRVGKKRAGRELDGRTWDEYPGGAA